jgi:hypothetical protein
MFLIEENDQNETLALFWSFIEPLTYFLDPFDKYFEQDNDQLKLSKV